MSEEIRDVKPTNEGEEKKLDLNQLIQQYAFYFERTSGILLKDFKIPLFDENKDLTYDNLKESNISGKLLTLFQKNVSENDMEFINKSISNIKKRIEEDFEGTNVKISIEKSKKFKGILQENLFLDLDIQFKIPGIVKVLKEYEKKVVEELNSKK